METLNIARKLADLNEKKGAIQAYTLVISENNGIDPTVDLEAALYIFENGGDYKISYTIFINLYNNGHYQNEILDVLISSFYTPNALKIQKKYSKNIKNLKEYKYNFKSNFIDFDNLKIKFFPYDEDGYIPFYPDENRFGEYININKPVIDRYFFKDLDNPILAEDVYSQYQLEYLYDNVRRSEWVAKDNHVYLNYTDFEKFCAYLQILNFGKMLAFQKFIFLIEDDISMYPIDFKEKFNIDYSEYTVKQISPSEVHRLIWHTQLSSHNGGDFFNEVFDGHPNLMVMHSMMFDRVDEYAARMIEFAKQKSNTRYFFEYIDEKLEITKYILFMNKPTFKDAFIALHLAYMEHFNLLDHTSRISPAILFQPHFGNMDYKIYDNEQGNAVLISEQLNQIKNSTIFKNFKYIKTFTPLRRITTSYAAANRYMRNLSAVNDTISMGDFNIRLRNRSFYIDKYDRLYADSILVRFEDGKLNPTATFTKLCEFLDLPYTESMKYCSFKGQRDIKSAEDNVIGFDTSSVYKQYEDFAYDHEKYLVEYFFRDIYKLYGYNFMFYDGKELSLQDVYDILKKPRKYFDHLKEGCVEYINKNIKEGDFFKNSTNPEEQSELLFNDFLMEDKLKIHSTVSILYKNLRYINFDGQPLVPMKKLELDTNLLENPIYK